MDDLNKDKNNKKEQKQDKHFYHNGKYYTEEEFFNPENEENEIDPTPTKGYKWIKGLIAFLISISLLSSMFAIWPKMFNFATIEFLQISSELSKNEDVQLYKESVVVVSTGSSKGTGFLYSENGYIMTNYHVIDNDDTITVTFHDGKIYKAEVVNSDEELDIAILKIDGHKLDYHTLKFEENWESGQPVYIIGNPLYFNFIANKGDVLGVTVIQKIPVLIIDAPIYKGNSGSPVINQEGKVIGIIYATTKINYYNEQKKVGLAIPIEYVDHFVELE